MAFNHSGFGKQSGPSAPAKSVVFGQFTPPPSSPSGPEVVERTRSPPLPFGNSSGPAARPFQPFGASREPEASQRVLSPPSAFENRRAAAGPSFSSAADHRPVDITRGLDNAQISFVKDYDAQTHPRPSFVTSLVASHNSGTSATAKVAQFQDLKRTRSPPLLPRDEEFPRKSSQTTITRPALTSSIRDDNIKLRGNHPNLPAYQDQSRFSPRLGLYDSESSMGQLADVQAQKRTRSPPLPSANGVPWENPQFTLNDSKRLGARSNVFLRSPDSQTPQRSALSMNNTVTSSSRSTASQVSKRTRSPTFLSTDEGFQGNPNSTQYDTEREMQAKAKRLARFKVELSENVEISPDVADQRFSINRQEHSAVDRQKFGGECAIESSRDYPNNSITSDYEGSRTSSIIIGLCPDMCPESERAERERKGDLDQYERLDGDRNQSSVYLAVKKYNRTAEREANLIRPMAILQKTAGYLLDLLNQPYDERFLGLYNFLWDRMRAIRMDLRMQHIFNQGAITMLEQMIRLHIIAMHELCEHTKGEGFSEGFDAHLNIEQMNKTSVELFQMYDDHRKKGINVPTEKEFRGYYALLKLDKHPGYKVEPAELSLDLAKMTPEIRQMPEVLFARDVARACRTGNFIAFFRLARKASYLQACLMHAHFAKLRAQAFASLHAGLLNNQGLPVAHVRRWLGMEEEDIESLLEYHGFSIKEFEEPYMVKDGPFLNSDKDYPTKCSKLVHMKRSESIVEDILASNQVISSPTGATKAIQLGKIHKHDAKTPPYVERKISIHPVDEAMPDSIAISLQNNSTPVQPVSETSMVDQQSQVGGHQVTVPCISPWGFSVADSSPKSQPAKVVMEEKRNNDTLFKMTPEKKIVSGMEGLPMQVVSKTPQQDRSPSFKRYDHSVENAVPESVAIDDIEDDEPSVTFEENENFEAMENENDEVMEKENDKVLANYLEEEVALAKLKLIIRLWRRRSLKQKELREQRQLAANAALNSLSAGPPIRQNKDQLSTVGEFDIDHVMRERSEKHEQSWSRLNVSDVIASILGSRNPDAKCLCWKIILCSEDSLAGDEQMQSSHISHLAAEPWLFSKLMPPRKDDDNNLLVSSNGLSIWKKWVPSKSGTDVSCCFSIVKKTKFDHLSDAMSGASAIMFLVSDSIPWKLQKVQLHNLLMSIPSGSRLPLLILSGSYCEEILDPYSVIVNELGLHNLDKSRVNSFSVKFLVDNQQMGYSDGFFSDEQLREGLQWLASETPQQPVVYSVKTRELVLTHLSYALEVLDKLSDYEVNPNHCISAFNEALDQSLGKIVAAAKANPTNWPCPEIASVEESSDEHFLANWCLPILGWSSAARIEPLVSALRDLKLTAFPDDISWLSRGANMGKEIENQRFQLENCLVSYLTLSSQMMGVPLATKEASIMLQRSTRLELHNSSYYIIPKWVMIFRRIFNWRLMSLTNWQLSTAYVLEHHLVSPPTGDLDKLGLESCVSSPYNLSHPSLDEIMEVGRSPFLTETAQSQPQVHYLPEMEPNGEVHETSNTNNLVDDERNSSENGKRSVSEDFACITSKLNSRGGEITVSRHVTKEADSLSKLLEQCILVQNTNDQKLSVYF
ncbi:hypothetical protein JRO89_XS03G0188500 [Xanthoceras sorbifolium]|uniref:PCI domain-containing protein n=1 Tax=Xanthoceras sorbifolium TaxID=99658 RepID=A0ABQ8IAJ3_9ROSI|nr:hypothetical protein JRO89_XS03G0188500 [Xanthoceras sorbifolium]